MEGTGTGRTAGLAGNGDAVGVAAELGDVFLHPLAGLTHIVQGVVAGGTTGFFRQLGMGEETVEAQAVVDGDNDDILPLGKAGAVADHFAAGACHHAAAVDPQEYGQFVIGTLGGGPDV